MAIKNNGFINLTKNERRYSIYRIMSLERLLEMFEQNANFLVKPIKWDDPFENFIAHLKGRLPDGEIVEFAQRYDFFGQCWTITGGTDAMWRIYSTNKRSVRIKVRIAKLYNQILQYALGIPFIGRVRYLSESELQKWAKRIIHSTNHPNVELLAKTFLVKRTAFSHENEIRLLYCGVGREQSMLYKHHFDCHNLIEEIQIDPRLMPNDVEKFADEIKIRTNYRGPIVQSKLYNPPKDFYLNLNDSFTILPKTYERITYSGNLRRITYSKSNFPQLVLPSK